MRASGTPRAIRRSITAPNELPDSPGPSSAIATIASPCHASSIAGSIASARRNGSPTGRTVSGRGASCAAAISAASPAPMLRTPITRRGPGAARAARRAAARYASGYTA
jgi:hypothetical protein